MPPKPSSKKTFAEKLLDSFVPMPTPVINVKTAALKDCHCCSGTGKEADNVKLGRSLSGLRLRKAYTLRAFARELGISHTFLWQLENGKRNWTPELERNYRELL